MTVRIHNTEEKGKGWFSADWKLEPTTNRQRPLNQIHLTVRKPTPNCRSLWSWSLWPTHLTLLAINAMLQTWRFNYTAIGVFVLQVLLPSHEHKSTQAIKLPLISRLLLAASLSRWSIAVVLVMTMCTWTALQYEGIVPSRTQNIRVQIGNAILYYPY
jgi:hypothetical protein